MWLHQSRKTVWRSEKFVKETSGLALAVVGVDGERPALVVLDDQLDVAAEPVEPVDAVVAPVADEQVVLEQRDAVQVAHLAVTEADSKRIQNGLESITSHFFTMKPGSKLTNRGPLDSRRKHIRVNS